jgi:predicted O-methyltransferase YrrM
MKESENHPHVPQEKAELFESPDSDGSTEYEYNTLIHSLVRAFKPSCVLETGTGYALTTFAIGRALTANKNHGHLWSIENNERLWRLAKNSIGELPVTLLHEESMDFIKRTPDTFDFAFLDSDLAVRGKELNALIERGKLLPGALICVHDTSKLRTWDGKPDPNTQKFWDCLERLAQIEDIRYIEFPLSRGLVVAQRCV